MTSYRTKYPKILWGAAFANTLNIGYWLDESTSGSEPRDGSEQLQCPSGVEDAWTVGTDYLLQGTVGWIPQADTASPVATGWDGATGFRAFLEWARDKNVIRFYPDASDAATHIDCYLVDPMKGMPEPEPNGMRRVALKLRNASTAFDGY